MMLSSMSQLDLISVSLIGEVCNQFKMLTVYCQNGSQSTPQQGLLSFIAVRGSRNGPAYLKIVKPVSMCLDKSITNIILVFRVNCYKELTI